MSTYPPQTLLTRLEGESLPGKEKGTCGDAERSGEEEICREQTNNHPQLWAPDKD